MWRQWGLANSILLRKGCVRVLYLPAWAWMDFPHHRHLVPGRILWNYSSTYFGANEIYMLETCHDLMTTNRPLGGEGFCG